MAGGDQTGEALAAFGLTIEDPADEEESADAFEVWAENVETVDVFVSMETQWSFVSVGKGVMVLGLRYEALRELWRPCGVKRKRRGEVMRGLRVMERAALPLLNGQRRE